MVGFKTTLSKLTSDRVEIKSENALLKINIEKLENKIETLESNCSKPQWNEFELTNEIQDRILRANNIIIYGIPTPENP